VIRYPYPIRIRGIVENDIRIYPTIRIRKNSRISANIYPRFHIRAPLLTTLSDIQLTQVILKRILKILRSLPRVAWMPIVFKFGTFGFAYGRII